MGATIGRVWITGGLAAALLALALAGCSSKPNTARSPDDGRGSYKVGKPYVIDGKTYYPAEDFSYSETGIASWYGPGFHGRNTASGEVYDQEQVSAAHKTLPMPSIVRVTNLDNGRTVIARVNDRGPFVSGRIIDMSKGGAQELGLDVTGVARVKVEIMRRESEIVKQIALNGGTVGDQMAALNNPSAAPPAVLDAPLGPVAANNSRSVAPQQPPTPVVSASQPIWSPGDPPPSRPVIVASDNQTAPPSSAAPAAPPIASSVVSSAPLVAAAPPVAPPAAGQASWSPQDQSPSARPSQLAPPPSTFNDQASGYLRPSATSRVAPPAPTSAPAPSFAPPGGTNQLYVQAGAFSQLDNAERVRVQLSQYGNASVSPVQSNGRELYRVRLGPMANADAADAIKARVLQAGYRDARVISD